MAAFFCPHRPRTGQANAGASVKKFSISPDARQIPAASICRTVARILDSDFSGGIFSTQRTPIFWGRIIQGLAGVWLAGAAAGSRRPATAETRIRAPGWMLEAV